MDWNESDVRRNRDYFQWKLHAIKQRADVVQAIEQGPFDFVLLDVRGREAFAFGHITGAWCVQLEELEPRWTLQIRPFVDSSKPAIVGRRPRLCEFYFAAASERKSVWSLVRQLRGPHLSRWA